MKLPSRCNTLATTEISPVPATPADVTPCAGSPTGRATDPRLPGDAVEVFAPPLLARRGKGAIGLARVSDGPKSRSSTASGAGAVVAELAPSLAPTLARVVAAFWLVTEPVTAVGSALTIDTAAASVITATLTTTPHFIAIEQRDRESRNPVLGTIRLILKLRSGV